MAGFNLDVLKPSFSRNFLDILYEDKSSFLLRKISIVFSSSLRKSLNSDAELNLDAKRDLNLRINV